MKHCPLLLVCAVVLLGCPGNSSESDSWPHSDSDANTNLDGSVPGDAVGVYLDSYVPPDGLVLPTTLKRTFKLKLPLFQPNSAWNQRKSSA